MVIYTEKLSRWRSNTSERSCLTRVNCFRTSAREPHLRQITQQNKWTHFILWFSSAKWTSNYSHQGENSQFYNTKNMTILQNMAGDVRQLLNVSNNIMQMQRNSAHLNVQTFVVWIKLSVRGSWLWGAKTNFVVWMHNVTRNECMSCDWFSKWNLVIRCAITLTTFLLCNKEKLICGLKIVCHWELLQM